LNGVEVEFDEHDGTAVRDPGPPSILRVRRCPR
jgi:hypothetical protein